MSFTHYRGLQGLILLLYPSLITGGVAFVLAFLVSAGIADPRLLLLIIPFIILIFILALYSDKPDVMRNTAISFLGIVYVSIPLSVINFLAFPSDNAHMLYTPYYSWNTDAGVDK